MPNRSEHARSVKPVAIPAPSRAQRVGAALALAGAPVPERRLPCNKLARSIEQTFARPANPPAHAGFSLDGGRGRVQILLREQGAHLYIVALCPPAARDVVARALSHARYALALRGISVR